MSHAVFPIRHHGPGSARTLRRALEALNPDLVLVEGPPDADALLPLASAAGMEPPVALLIYDKTTPRHATYYPFATFSPEWQAIQFALSASIPVRFIDLPQAIRLAEPKETAVPEPPPTTDPFRWLAEAAGYADHESWWNHLVEERQESAGIFEAIMTVMTALRADGDVPLPESEARREAAMREGIRRGRREGYERMAVICGAWHAPALVDLPAAKGDKALLKGLPRVRVAAAWVPWTYGRLRFATGYGAGIRSPGWYEHVWAMGEAGRDATDGSIAWLSRVARLLRDEGLGASPAQVVDAVRLAESVAALRGRPLAGLNALNEATQAVFCFGSPLPLRLVEQKLIVGERLGAVPEEAPQVPLQIDINRRQKRLRLRPELSASTLNLDLRTPLNLERSHFLHRLTLLGIPWGQRQEVVGKKGTFHELWQLQWQPEFSVLIVEAGLWGNSVVDAVANRARDVVARSHSLPELTQWLDGVILAALDDVLPDLLDRLEAVAAVSADVSMMMAALPPLVRVRRYGDVRGTRTAVVGHVIAGLVTRICIGLPAALTGLDDEAALAQMEHISTTHGALATLQEMALSDAWFDALRRQGERGDLHGLVAGRINRLLLDAGEISADTAAERLGRALSPARAGAARGATPPGGSPVVGAAAWIEGFLGTSGLLLLHDDALWQLVDEWVTDLAGDDFLVVLPLLRRTFATFSRAARRQLGERVREGRVAPAAGDGVMVDEERAQAVLPLLATLLGLPVPEAEA